MRDEVRAGLDRAARLLPGAGFLDLSAGVNHPWAGGLGAFVGAEAGFRPRDNVELFGFGKADLVGVQAGVGARVTFP